MKVTTPHQIRVFKVDLPNKISINIRHINARCVINLLFNLVHLVDFIIFGKSLVQLIFIGFIAGYSKLSNQKIVGT